MTWRDAPSHRLTASKSVSQQSSPPRPRALVEAEELHHLTEVVDPKEALGLAAGVGAYHPRQAERPVGERPVRVLDQRLLDRWRGCLCEDCSSGETAQCQHLSGRLKNNNRARLGLVRSGWDEEG